ncbi:hypothetical protein V1511DRAFT_497612 [Dipodascopsis uninucleata]
MGIGYFLEKWTMSQRHRRSNTKENSFFDIEYDTTSTSSTISLKLPLLSYQSFGILSSSVTPATEETVTNASNHSGYLAPINTASIDSASSESCIIEKLNTIEQIRQNDMTPYEAWSQFVHDKKSTSMDSFIRELEPEVIPDDDTTMKKVAIVRKLIGDPATWSSQSNQTDRGKKFKERLIQTFNSVSQKYIQQANSEVNQSIDAHTLKTQDPTYTQMWPSLFPGIKRQLASKAKKLMYSMRNTTTGDIFRASDQSSSCGRSHTCGSNSKYLRKNQHPDNSICTFCERLEQKHAVSDSSALVMSEISQNRILEDILNSIRNCQTSSFSSD